MAENQLVDLSKQFAVDIIRLCDTTKTRGRATAVINQLLRSGTSIGANISESNNAQSTADYVSKLSIALKEADETHYWFDLLQRTNYIDQREYLSIDADVKELIAMLTALIKKHKTNIKQQEK